MRREDIQREWVYFRHFRVDSGIELTQAGLPISRNKPVLSIKINKERKKENKGTRSSQFLLAHPQFQ
ncbi:hypothetical protein M413DRAFT_448708 [Hebeloma cylindrosporum]|uniref:Uncharacterized protein n=1 Tax=Hebeloma cylindrosporum TaxID=76867 RepID=A0A0C2XH82_HEBCY|nr:hypothetical protein M413DRAFT_448708 [Hebeloma cylindrosporum h7]